MKVPNQLDLFSSASEPLSPSLVIKETKSPIVKNTPQLNVISITDRIKKKQKNDLIRQIITSAYKYN
ncbi:hypothetical protein ABEV37_10405 [Chromobacterium piscinae]